MSIFGGFTGSDPQSRPITATKAYKRKKIQPNLMGGL